MSCDPSPDDQLLSAMTAVDATRQALDSAQARHKAASRSLNECIARMPRRIAVEDPEALQLLTWLYWDYPEATVDGIGLAFGVGQGRSNGTASVRRLAGPGERTVRMACSECGAIKSWTESVPSRTAAREPLDPRLALCEECIPDYHSRLARLRDEQVAKQNELLARDSAQICADIAAGRVNGVESTVWSHDGSPRVTVYLGWTNLHLDPANDDDLQLLRLLARHHDLSALKLNLTGDGSST